MLNMTRSLGLGLAFAALLTATPVLSQETTDQATTTDQTTATDGTAAAVPPPPKPYVKNTYGDWTLRCLKVKSGTEPCELYQLLKDDKGNAVSEITMIALPAGKQAVAGATLIVPLETLLPKQLSIAIDDKEAKHYPFTFCAAVGCFARVGFTAEEVDQLKAGKKATVSVVPVAAPDKTVSVNISLKGFSDAFAAIEAENQPAQ